MYLIKDADSIILNAHETIKNGSVLLDKDRIARIGRGITAPDAEIIDARGCIVSPGFVNLHTHLYQSMLKGMRDDLSLVPWCEKVTFPFIGALPNDRAARQDAFFSFGMLGAIEQLRSGVTAFVDMDMQSSALLAAWRALGVRGVMAVQTANRWIPEQLRRPDAEQLKSIERFLADAGTDGLCRAALAPSTPFCCTAEYLQKLDALSRETGARLFLHVAETANERAESLRDTGLGPVAYLDSIGLLSERLTAVHCVQVDPAETEQMRQSGVTVCHCPKSNAKLGSGVAPVTRYLEKGIPIALGTDGAASNDLLDMFEEMRAAALLQRALHGENALPAADVFRMATEAGARALGLDAGVLAQGKKADLFLLDTQRSGMTPAHDPIQTLLWCGRAQDVQTVFVDGEPVLLQGRVTRVDEREALRRAREIEETCRKAIKA